ncbi:MAG: glutamine--fructose-6-phosphate transaminase (isomerizing) [Chloroflexi bacterium]|nr:glutamine--fructose-6-phosphate transaminase (isomerizing) [Chloroflexota bacterium]
MCGIIGYVGERPAAPILLEGLQRLEYRGYDSAGIALVTEQGHLTIEKAVGKLTTLVTSINGRTLPGSVGIGHTRWATHGKPSTENAHPHTDCRQDVVVIHNGIVENYLELKRALQRQGHTFASQTDSEVIPHLIEQECREGKDLATATRDAVRRTRGANAFIVMSSSEPDRVIAIRTGNAGGLVVGYGEGEMFLASDLPAILPHTRAVVFLAAGEMACVEAGQVTYATLHGEPLEKTPQTIAYDPVAAARGGYKHFMLKEIMEQPEAVTNTIRGRIQFDPPDVLLPEWPFLVAQTRTFERVVIVACGTSYHAGLIGRYLIEDLARLPVDVEIASEFRYRDPVVDDRTLLIAVAQSGETVDTLAAMEEGRARGMPQIAVTNVEGSQAARYADGALLIRAGQEIGVAATKTFTTTMVSLYLVGLYLGKVRGTISPEQLGRLIQDLAELPDLLGRVLQDESAYERLANRYARHTNFLFLGRGIHYPIALEGALKLKEISYIHAEGYAAGEMKHGPIALIDENMPVVALALQDGVYDKMVSNILEVKARDGQVIAIVTEGNTELQEHADHLIALPPVAPLLAPVVSVLPLQLLAYHIAVRRGCDVDQPRNLAKTVTVE